MSLKRSHSAKQTANFVTEPCNSQPPKAESTLSFSLNRGRDKCLVSEETPLSASAAFIWGSC